MSVSQVQDNYAALHQGFRWAVPEQFNMAQVCCRAGPPARRRRAHRHPCPPGRRPGPELQLRPAAGRANRLSAVLKVLGVQRGDRVAIVLPQRFETAVAYMAVLQMGAVGMPLSTLFGPEALEYRLQDSEARVAICDGACIDAINQVRDDCPLLETVIGVGEAGRLADIEFDLALAQEPGQFELVNTLADDPAVLIYTSGTTGNPKGALIPAPCADRQPERLCLQPELVWL
jgi:acetyl-CoA synthetase